MKANKQIIKHTKLHFKPAFPGLKGVDMFASQYPIEPVLVFTEYLMDRPVFGPHPHAGISVMTYMLPDSKNSFINRDSLGDFSEIEPGGLHISQAGRGLQHDEFPKVTGVEAHGFQIWINHADKDRLVEPKAIHASANEIAEISMEDYKLRIVHGEYNDQRSDYQMVTNVNLFHVYLNAGKTIALDAQEMAFIYTLNGNGNIENQEVLAQSMVNFSTEGNQVVITAGEEGLEFMFGTAVPLKEPITYGGPFVMTTPEQMADTKRRYGRGEMGELLPYRG
ncbi:MULTISPECIES: pirin family protein [Emticicia]|uniref:pirin family protein n=1 Tax=Emticicia TaxID=312278 RepID=UPI0007D8AF09|nr:MULTISPECIES: pirin-like C-terminal cupin domain-containing protein [Emticicia]